MPFAGDFTPPANPGETQPYSLDFTRQLATGDAIASATTSLAAYAGTDAEAAEWALGDPVVTGNLVSQNIGGALPGGLQPGVIYRWTVTAVTVSGRTLINYAHIACQAID